jgi:hypothetical protein
MLNFRTKISAIFQGILEFFAVFCNFYVFIPQFVAEPPTIFCGIPVAKQDRTVNGVGASLTSFLSADILLLIAVN